MNQELTNITTGKQIRHLRTQLGMTQEESFTPLETNSESKVAELPPLTEEEQLLHRYSSYPEGPFKVRFESGRLLRGFAAKEVAIAFSKELAEIKDVRVRYRKKRQ